MRRLLLYTLTCFLLLLAGCEEFGALAGDWDDFRCDRRVGVFENLRLGETNRTDYVRALNYLYSRRVDEVVFSGATTAHGMLGEFKALAAGFTRIREGEKGNLFATWHVQRTFLLAPSDAAGKYPPATFWERIWGEPWQESFVSAEIPADDAPPRLLIRSYYGAHLRVEEARWVEKSDTKSFTRKKTAFWDVEVIHDS